MEHIEIWKDVLGYETFYEVSTYGNVRTKKRIYIGKDGRRNCKNPKIISNKPHPTGYINIGLKDKNSITTRTSIHRLVAIAFIPKVEGKDYVNHINGIKTDNRVENLEWCTKKENSRHSIDTGLQVNRIGEEHHYAKLNEKDVLDIRAKYKPNGEYSTLKLAKEYKISNTNIKDIVNRKIWTHI